MGSLSGCWCHREGGWERWAGGAQAEPALEWGAAVVPVPVPVPAWAQAPCLRRRNVEKRWLLENLDGAFLVLDEIVDGG